MPDYKNGKIYKLWSPEGDEIYIGSTTQSLALRKAKHKNDRCSSKVLFEKYTDIRIELLEEYPCDNKEQLNKKEGEYIRNNNCVNRCVAGRTNDEYGKEYRKNNKEKYIEQYKNYYEDNKKHIQEQHSTPFVCECGRTIRLDHKSGHLKTKIHIKLLEELK